MCARTEWFRRSRSLLLVMILIMADPSSYGFGVQNAAQVSPPADSFRSLDDMLHYIATGWDRLTRSLGDCATFADSKTDGEPVLYLPAEVQSPPELAGIEKRCSVRVERLD